MTMLPGLFIHGRLTSKSSDEELVVECLNGNEGAWSILVDKYKDLVYSIPLRYHLPPEEAADVFQSVWTDLYADLPRLRNAGALRGWLATAAAHKCARWKQRRKRQPESYEDTGLEPKDDGETYLSLRLAIEREQAVRDALLLIPERCRRVVELLFFREPPLRYDEVAQELGLATGSIGFIRGRCLTKLRKALASLGF